MSRLPNDPPHRPSSAIQPKPRRLKTLSLQPIRYPVLTRRPLICWPVAATAAGFCLFALTGLVIALALVPTGAAPRGQGCPGRRPGPAAADGALLATGAAGPPSADRRSRPRWTRRSRPR